MKTITTIILAIVATVTVKAQPYWEKLHQSGNGLIFETSTSVIPFVFTHNSTFTFALASGYTYAQGNVELLLRSDNNGSTWTEASANNLDLSHAKGIYASNEGTLLVVRSNEIHRSTDNGENFTLSALDVNLSTDRSSAVYANGVWYIIVKTSGQTGQWVLLKSTDDGVTFTTVGGGVQLTTIYDSNEPMAVVGNTIVVRDKYTTDEGATWNDVQGNPDSHSLGIFIGYYNGEYYYVGKATASSTEFIKTPDVENPVWTRVGTQTHGTTIKRHFMTSNGAIFIQTGAFVRAYINGTWNNDINEGYVEQPYQYPYPTFAETPDGNIIARALLTGEVSGLFKYIGPGNGVIAEITDIDKEPDFTLFPNPASEVVYIQTDNQQTHHSTVQLYDVNGKLLFESKLRDIEGKIDLSQFDAGIYQVRLPHPTGNLSKKLVIR